MYNNISKMISQGIQQNPALAQLLKLKSMLDTLPKEKQEELVEEFISKLEQAVKEVESK